MAFRYSGTGWRVADAIRTFGDQIMALRGHSTSYKVDGTLGDADHSNRVSDHNPDENGIVRALDFYEDQPGRVDAVAEALRASRDPRIKYFIHDDRMFSSYSNDHRRAWEWGLYTGPNGHETHGHLSVLPIGDNDPTPFNIQEDDMAILTDDEQRQLQALLRAITEAGSNPAFVKFIIDDIQGGPSRKDLITRDELNAALAGLGGSGLTEAQVKAIVESARIDVP